MACCACCITAKSWRKFPRTRWRKKGRSTSVPLAAPAPRLRTKRLVEFGACGRDLTRKFPRVARGARDRLEALDLGAVRLHGAHEHARSSGRGRCGRRAHQGHAAGARAFRRRQRPLVPLDPFVGAQLAVAEAARNVAARARSPWAATNCLNFGSPEKPEVMWQFSHAIDGIAEACPALEIPITGGNVSFYNETLGRSIDPTPVLGVLGMIEDASRALGMGFRAEGDVIVLLDGDTQRLAPRKCCAASASTSPFTSCQSKEPMAAMRCANFPPRNMRARSRHRRRRASRHRSRGGKTADRAAGRARERWHAATPRTT